MLHSFLRWISPPKLPCSMSDQTFRSKLLIHVDLILHTQTLQAYITFPSPVSKSPHTSEPFHRSDEVPGGGPAADGRDPAPQPVPATTALLQDLGIAASLRDLFSFLLRGVCVGGCVVGGLPLVLFFSWSGTPYLWIPMAGVCFFSPIRMFSTEFCRGPCSTEFPQQVVANRSFQRRLPSPFHLQPRRPTGQCPRSVGKFTRGFLCTFYDEAAPWGSARVCRRSLSVPAVDLRRQVPPPAPKCVVRVNWVNYTLTR